MKQIDYERLKPGDIVSNANGFYVVTGIATSPNYPNRRQVTLHKVEGSHVEEETVSYKPWNSLTLVGKAKRG